MDAIYSAAEAAKQLGVNVRVVQRWSERLGLRRLGTAYALTDADIERLRAVIPGRVGNPQFGSREVAFVGVKAAAKARRKKKRAAKTLGK